MADKPATEAAEKKAKEEGVDLAQVEPSGSQGKVTVDDVKQASLDGEKFVVRVSAASGSYLYDAGDRVFYRDPMNHPQGPDAQMVTEEEFSKYSASGHLVKMKGGE